MHPKNPPKKLPPGSKPSQPDKVYEAGNSNRAPVGSEVRLEAYSQEFRGPLPHPDILKGYEAVCPGAANDIVQSFIKEGEHRRNLQVREQTMCEDWARADVGLQNRGQIFGFVIAIIGVGGGLYVAATGAPAAGAAVSGTTLLGIVVAFLRQRRLRKVEVTEQPSKSSGKKE